MADPKQIYDAILAFSAKRPIWVQDALRRLVLHGELGSTDLDEAVAMCKQAHGLTSGAPTPVPLAQAHMPTAKGAASVVTLTALSDLQHVNALLPKQVLDFSPTGLSTIYGSNGAGKSGYARVLKRLCRARGAIVPILPNVFDHKAGTPSATLAYAIGGTPHTFSGALDHTAPPLPDALSHIAVYDRASGTATTTALQPVELLPPGLDLLPKLKEVLEHVATVINQDKGNDAQSVGYPRLEPQSPSAAFLASLSKTTTVAQLDAACAWSAEDDKMLTTVIGTIAELQANDPEVKATEQTQRAARLDKLIKALEKVQRHLRPEVLDRIDQRIRELATTEHAIALQRGTVLPADALPGTGAEAWKRLWEAARAFSTEHAYPDHAFPHTANPEPRCVLCQQPLDAPARARLDAFESFVIGRLSTELDAARDALAKAVSYVSEAIEEGLLSGDLAAEAALVEGLGQGLIPDFVTAAVARRDALLIRLDAEQADVAIPELSAAPIAPLQAASRAATERARELLATRAGDALQTAHVTRKKLEDRKLLHGARPMLQQEIERLARAEQRTAAIKDCSTSTLSTTAGNLTEQHVTSSLAEAFNNELEALGGGNLRVALVKSKTIKGTPSTALALIRATTGAAIVHEVFSEGEQRAVALAQFFAELHLAPTKSAIVFDDPVTSLDHGWRDRVAERLAKESLERQVVVLTHDIMFLCMLRSHCQALDAAHFEQCVQLLGGAPGHCSTDLPWDSRGVKNRVKHLRARLMELRDIEATVVESELSQKTKDFLERLRETWERAIEECLFNGVVVRHDPHIKPGMLAKLHATVDHTTSAYDGWKTCCEWVHDPSMAGGPKKRSAQDLCDQLNRLVTWVTNLKSDRGSAGNNLPSLAVVSLERLH